MVAFVDFLMTWMLKMSSLFQVTSYSLSLSAGGDIGVSMFTASFGTVYRVPAGSTNCNKIL